MIRRLFERLSKRTQSGDGSCLPEGWVCEFAPMFGLFDEVPKTKKVLVDGHTNLVNISQSSVIIKGLMKAGYAPTVLVGEDAVAREAYRRLGINSFLNFRREVCPALDLDRAQRLLDSCPRYTDVLHLTHEGACVGKYAVSSLLRKIRCGHLDIDVPDIHEKLIHRIAQSVSFVEGARKLIQQGYGLAVLVDRGYTPWGELFDVMVNSGGRAVLWMASHRNGSLILKRYHVDNANEHAVSLSADSWASLLQMPWTDQAASAIHNEIRSCYESQEWYGEVGTQVDKQMMDAESLRKRLGLDPAKPTAVIFSHIFWDATFFWGEDLFADYEEWFIESIRAACANPNVNWLVKVHPANRTKNIREGISGASSEVVAIQAKIGDLPPHVRLLDEGDSLSTYSLFSVMDYCLTVRGTVGIEAAMHGVRVLTAGTGRYDRHGFTHDYDTKDDYLDALLKLEKLSKPTRDEQELAEKFAFGTFLMRPFELSSLKMYFERSDKATLSVALNVRDTAALTKAPDIARLADWFRDDCDDYLSVPVSEVLAVDDGDAAP